MILTSRMSMIAVNTSTIVSAAVVIYLLFTVAPFILLMLREARSYKESGVWNLGRVAVLCVGITFCYFPVFMALPSSFFYTRLFLVACIVLSVAFLAVRVSLIVRLRRRAAQAVRRGRLEP